MSLSLMLLVKRLLLELQAGSFCTNIIYCILLCVFLLGGTQVTRCSNMGKGGAAQVRQFSVLPRVTQLDPAGPQPESAPNKLLVSREIKWGTEGVSRCGYGFLGHLQQGY